MMKQVLVAVAVALVATSAFAAGDVKVGKAKYDMMCQSCHGATGAGDGPAGKALKPPARNFTDAAWQASRKDEDLRKVITKGGAAAGLSPLMPALGAAMKPEEVDGVIAYIRSLKK